MLSWDAVIPVPSISPSGLAGSDCPMDCLKKETLG